MVESEYSDDEILSMIVTKLEEGLCPERALLKLPINKLTKECITAINVNGVSASIASKKIKFQYKEISGVLSGIFENDNLKASQRVSDLATIIKNRRKLFLKKESRYKSELRRIKLIISISTLTTAILAIFSPIFSSLSNMFNPNRQPYLIHPFIIFFGVALSNSNFLLKVGNEKNKRKNLILNTVIYFLTGIIGNSILKAIY